MQHSKLVGPDSRRKKRPRFRTVVLVLLVLALAGFVTLIGIGSRMPGKSHRGPLSPLADEERAIAVDLRRHVEKLAGEIGERNTRRPAALDAARAYIRSELERAAYLVEEESWKEDGVECANVIAERPGVSAPGEIILIGAHYDSVANCPGADDNGSGVAALLALAERFATVETRRTLRFVAFPNEEPPYFFSSAMGSAHHARRCRERDEDVVVMLSLETLGYYSVEPGTQRFPVPGLGFLYPTTGDYLVIVGNFASRRRVREAVGTFRTHAAFPCEGAALPWWLPGVGWSDQLSFWREGYAALMATDTAPFRNPHYHTATDMPDSLDYERFARAVGGLRSVIAKWADGED